MGIFWTYVTTSIGSLLGAPGLMSLSVSVKTRPDVVKCECQNDFICERLPYGPRTPSRGSTGVPVGSIVQWMSRCDNYTFPSLGVLLAYRQQLAVTDSLRLPLTLTASFTL